MSVVIPQLQTDFDVSLDRRSADIPVVCDRRKPRGESEGVTKCVFEALPTTRRLASLKEDWDKGETTGALGALALTAINFPEDLRDIGAGIEQVEAYLKGQKYKGAYDYKNFQHEFSFFRGTLLQSLIDMKKHPKLAKILLNWDKSLLRTKFGKKVLELLGVKISGEEVIKKFNKETSRWEIAKDLNGRIKTALSFEGGKFGTLTAHSLSRSTLIGTVVMATLELSKIQKAACKGDNIFEKGENAAKQTFKSGINVASITAGIAYGGAIGSKYGKCFGSLVGMGIGAIAGRSLSKKLQDAI